MAVVVGALLVGATLAGGITGNCMDLGLITFGCSEEHHIETETEIEESVVQSLDQRNDSTVQMTVTTDQEVVLEFKNPNSHIDLVEVNQDVTGHIKFVAKIDQQLAGDLRAVLKSEIDEKIKNLGPGTQAFFEKKPNGITTEKVRTALYTAIDESTSQANLASIAFKVANTQRVTINVYSKYIGNLRINQNIALQVFARAVVEQAAASAMKSDVIKNLKKELETSGGATEGYSATKIVFVLIVAAVAVYGAYYYLNKKKNKTRSAPTVEAPDES